MITQGFNYNNWEEFHSDFKLNYLSISDKTSPHAIEKRNEFILALQPLVQSVVSKMISSNGGGIDVKNRYGNTFKIYIPNNTN